MAVIWNLRKWLVIHHNIYTASQLQALIEEKEGVYLSVQSLSKLMYQTPDGVRFRTMQILCNALSCDLGEFLTITPDPVEMPSKTVQKHPRYLYGPKSSLDGNEHGE